MNNMSNVRRTMMALAAAAIAGVFVLGITTTLLAGPNIIAKKVQADCSPELTKCADKIVFGPTNANGVVVSLDSLTHKFYNAKSGALKYTIYDGPNAITSLTCNRATVRINSPKLKDATTYTLVISAPGASASYSFTTSSQKCQGTKSTSRR